MKIVRVIARLNVGGPALHVAWLTAGMRAAGHESLLVCGTVPEGEADMSDFARSLGVEPVVIAEMSREISVRDFVTIWKLYQLFRRERPDIVHTHTAKAGTVGRVAAWLYRWTTFKLRARRCRFVHTFHGHVFHSYYGRAKTRFFIAVERLLARSVTDAIVVISPAQYAEIHDCFGVGRAEQFRIIPLGLDLTLFAEPEARRQKARDEMGAGAGDVLVGIVGRLTEVKDHNLFLRVVASYKESYIDRAEQESGARVRFIIIGDGHLRAALEADAARLGIADAVEFAGVRRDPEFFYPALDVVALTSLNEGTPLTLIEAMANERAIVATAVGGVRDLLGDQSVDDETEARDGFELRAHGALVTSREPQAFASALHRLISDSRLREQLGKRGRRFVHTNYSKDRLLRDVTRLYEELLAE